MIKLAVIGKDVSQSVSPQIHNFIAKQLNLSIAYDKISIPEEEFESRIESIFSEYDGFNVTIPYKLTVISYLRSVEGDAAAFGAVNTVLSESRAGYNTDGLGFMQMLENEGIEVVGQKVLLLGAGGAGRSVAKKLSDAGAFVEIYDRNAANAKVVAQEFENVTAIDCVTAKQRSLIINATGVGMHKTVGISPVTAEIISACTVAVDLIYVPEQSEFLRIAKNLGKKTVNGRAMLFYQAYYSDCYYFGLKPCAAQAADLFEKYLKEIVQ